LTREGIKSSTPCAICWLIMYTTYDDFFVNDMYRHRFSSTAIWPIYPDDLLAPAFPTSGAPRRLGPHILIYTHCVSVCTRVLYIYEFWVSKLASSGKRRVSRDLLMDSNHLRARCNHPNCRLFKEEKSMSCLCTNNTR
jgi:hypothetical protein